MEEEKKEKNEDVLRQAQEIKSDGSLNGQLADSDSDDLKACLKDKEEYLNGWKRAKADLENYKKEEAARAEMLAKFANVALLRDLLSVMDSFDLAISAEKENKGLILIRTQLESFLLKNGMEPIKAMGEKFDPEIHEAVQEEEGKGESGIVTAEIERGWKLYEKVIRPAKVKVSK
ncbi:MAG: nucleotide exchange factor GrpE [Candidatus Paceibacterota bacterium]